MTLSTLKARAIKMYLFRERGVLANKGRDWSESPLADA